MTTSERFSVRLEKQYFNFCSAHFLVFADGTREPLHGHNYRVSVVLEGPLKPEGVVFDFMVVKPLVKAVCDSIDHKTLVPRDNPWLTVETHADERAVEVRHGADRFVLPLADVVVLPIANLSVEHLARWVGDRVEEELAQRFPDDPPPAAIEVEVEESPGQSATFRRARS
jgi:6-pyruvoyltetrahydropterin/6-carboxytetrahydropterin synthase